MIKYIYLRQYDCVFAYIYIYIYIGVCFECLLSACFACIGSKHTKKEGES